MEPLLGPGVTLVRNPDRSTCVQLLQAARCVIMPIQSEEPFDVVVLEAMATGTPVGALHGSARIRPDACRRHVSTHFSTDRMAAGYENVYAVRTPAGPRRVYAQPAVADPGGRA